MMRYWLLSFLIALAPFCYADEIADLTIGSSISVAEEERIGTKWWRQNYSLLEPYNNFLLQHYLEDLVARLRQGEELAHYEMNIRILSSQEFNAFAAPGGIVGVNLGLWRLAETESEFASVLAHELAHLSQRHFIRMLEDAQQRNDVSLAGALAGLGLVMSGNIPAGILAIYGTANFQLESQLRTSRRFETEADSQAILFMRRGQFSPSDAANLYRRLLQAGGEESGAEYMRTHPFLADRINAAQLRALGEERISTSHYSDYPYTRIYIAAQSDLPILHNYLAMGGTFAQYAQAMKLLNNGKGGEAAILLKKVSDTYPLSDFLFLSYVEALIHAKQTKLAIDLLHKEKRYKRDDDIVWSYYLALAYAAEGSYEKAIRSMEVVTKNRPHDEHPWQLLQGYYEKSDDEYNSFRTRMAYQLLTGETRSAEINYQLAKQEVNTDEVLLARLEILHNDLAVD